MGVAMALGRAGVRGRGGALAGLAVVVAAGVGVSLASLEAANRTEDAYPDYLRRAEVAELVVNPSLATGRAQQLIASTPGVRSFTSDDFLIATLDDGAPRTQAEVDGGIPLQVRTSPNGRYTTQDRPVVHDGRMVRAGDEAFLSVETAQALDLAVGDEVPMAFWAPSYNTPGIGPGQEDVVEPVGVSSARVVGTGVFADEVLADGLYPRRRMLVTPDVAEGVTCTFASAAADETRSLEELLPEIVPPTCALAYRYFSIRVDGGEEGVARVTEALATAFEAENERLPPVLREADVGYIVIPSATRDERERLEESLRPTVTALRLFAVAAGLSTVVVASLGAVRFARREQRAVAIWQHLGVTRLQRLAAVAAPLAAAAIVGLLGAVGLGLAASGLGPVASARALAPVRRLSLSGEVLLAVLAPAALLLLVGVAAAAVSVALGGRDRRATRRSVVSRAALVLHPARALGVQAAVKGAGSGAVLAGSVAAVSVVLASVVFATNVSGLVNEPRRFGWPYDAAVIVGFGYGGADAEAIGRSLDRPEVARWGLAQIGTVTITGETVASVGALEGFDAIPLPVVDGVLPEADDEIALGAQTARELGIEVGDDITLTSFSVERPATVTGIVVLPAVGAYESDRASSGTGAYLPNPFVGALVTAGEAAAGLPAGTFDDLGPGAFVAIDLAAGVEPAAFLADLDGELRSWDINGFDSFRYADPVRPAAIADVADMRRVPLALGGFLALAMAAGLGVAIAVATRARRSELAVLGALGCSPRQLAASVRWHALAVAALAVAVGLPVGIAAGRTLYRAFAVNLAVVPDATVPVLGILAVAVATIAIALLVAAVPARRIARRPLAAVLRQA